MRQAKIKSRLGKARIKEEKFETGEKKSPTTKTLCDKWLHPHKNSLIYSHSQSREDRRKFK